MAPFLDLGRQAAAQRDGLEDAFATVLARGRFIGGPALDLLDARFSAAGALEDPVEHRSFLFNR